MLGRQNDNNTYLKQQSDLYPPPVPDKNDMEKKQLFCCVATLDCSESW